MAEERKSWTAEEEETWDALVGRFNRDHPGRIHGFKTPEEEEAAWDSIVREFPSLREARIKKVTL